MIEENKYCSDVMKEFFDKEFVMNKEDDEGFANSTKCWICDIVFVDGDVKIGAISLGNIGALRIEIIMSRLN